jgi:hypothetical protein
MVCTGATVLLVTVGAKLQPFKISKQNTDWSQCLYNSDVRIDGCMFAFSERFGIRLYLSVEWPLYRVPCVSVYEEI